jgi:hypothetical protein
MKKHEKCTSTLSKIETLRGLISSDRPFFEAIWTAREKIFNHFPKRLQSWHSFAECVPEVGVSNEVSRQDQFVASLVYHVERFKIALCEKQVLKTTSLQTLQRKLKKTIKDFDAAQSDRYIGQIDKAFRDFFYNDLQDISVSERARIITKEKGKAKSGLIPVLVDCNDQERLFVGGGVQEKTYLNFDLLAAYQSNQKFLVDRYVRAFKKIQKRYDKPLTICFRKKYAGAYGIIRLLPDIHKRLPDNPVAVYSQTLDKITFMSKEKSRNRKCVLFGDVVITGFGTTSWKKQMARRKFSVRNILIFTEFGDKEKVKNYPESLVMEIMPNISCKGGRKKKLPGIYHWEDLDGRFAELDIERMFIPKILRQDMNKKIATG